MRHFWEFDEDAYREAVYDDGFDAGVEKGIVQGRAQGIAQERAKLYSLVQDGDLAPDKAAAKLGLALDEFEKQMTAAGFKTPSAV